jgi:hypothetical protein
MIRETHDKLRPVLERRDHGFRWRGKDISRIEGLSDGVFAFSDLLHLMHGFVSFGVCFALLLMIWHAQYIYFRRYALDDKTSFLLNAMLLFVVAFYVYPLKFLFTTLVNGITGYHEVSAAGDPIQAMQRADWRPLMEIYSAGFMALYVIFALLYWHAYRLRKELDLNPMEIYETRGVVQENMLMIGIGTLALALAYLNLPRYSGLSYALIGPTQTWLGLVHGKRRRVLSQAPVEELR